MEVVLRKANPDDKAFIYATMLRGLYYGNPFYGAINKKAFFDNYPKVVDNLLLKPDIKVTIACLSIDNTIILGYSITEGGVLHYIAVKEAWRMQGIARKLLAGSEIRLVTHTTKTGEQIRKRKGWDLNPFKI